jgi:hypothetical protein
MQLLARVSEALIGIGELGDASLERRCGLAQHRVSAVRGGQVAWQRDEGRERNAQKHGAGRKGEGGTGR